ncbi:Ankyrin-3 [Camellia lanceoleosa]|uniref:Ankyrin-3 n=1 Tax=Camellia lanceoleosa TaxID=1840588 RepID=A0ACC0IHS0_9ERIC|nr:Ankyrin-3 [Camellia lanceoleosa]
MLLFPLIELAVSSQKVPPYAKTRPSDSTASVQGGHGRQCVYHGEGTTSPPCNPKQEHCPPHRNPVWQYQRCRKNSPNVPSLFTMANKKGETALHIAAREGHANIVRLLIKYAEMHDSNGAGAGTKQMIGARNVDKDTALHLAVKDCRGGGAEVVKLVAEADPGISYGGNRVGESPLYLAAERGDKEMVVLILNTCISPGHSGPMGRTALHAAVISDCQEIALQLLEKMSSLTKIGDRKGWTPLHCAAHFNNVTLVKLLLNWDKMAAYLQNSKGMTALHIATSRGHIKTMEELISQCPDCCEMVNGSGQNALHIAVESNKKEAVDVILRNSSFNSIINGKDYNGNTPLHLLAILGYDHLRSVITDPRVDKRAYNLENLTALDIVLRTLPVRQSTTTLAGELKKAGATVGLRKEFDW